MQAVYRMNHVPSPIFTFLIDMQKLLNITDIIFVKIFLRTCHCLIIYLCGGFPTCFLPDVILVVFIILIVLYEYAYIFP